MENKNLKKQQEQEDADSTVKPDPETLGKTDPQEDMKGPVSSLMHKGGKLMESNKSKEEASEEHDKKM